MRLSCPETAALTHALRAAHDAILIGVGTLLADNPRLTVRLVEGSNPQPVVLDSHLRTPLEAAILNHPDRHPWIVTGPKPDEEKRAALKARGARVIALPANGSGEIDLPALLRTLYGLGARSLMVEGGARVLTSFLCACLADRLVVTLAPRLIGGYRAFFPSTGESPGCLSRLDPMYCETVGTDVVVWGRIRYGE